ncbi:hypothetical protein [Ewingella americana]|uniref:Uncharacterized protein n=1 Tax=Ewingella americana TaxID=41202 RepID=A0A502GE24_9GAMM|nr:hypothetical protein [Ewingella americana]TPG59882.1 hypothetical protein EAH77_15055 [Ewingella americana]
MKIQPQSGKTYTLQQILTNMDLRDAPSLNFTIDGIETCLNDSHVSEEDLLTIPGFAESLWNYVRETSEWVPIFQYSKANTQPMTDFIDYEDLVDPHSDYDAPKELWCIPKGFPRQQYYRVKKDGSIVGGLHDDGSE